MEKVPQIVPERLRVATALVNHPDADVLTAFAERSLPELERAMVLEHLACCSDCREVVALALPESVPVTAHLAPSPTRWLGWPQLRWGFALAGVAVIVSVGVVQYRRQSAATMAQKGISKFASLAKNEAVVPAPATALKEPESAAAGKEQGKAERSDLLTVDKTDKKVAVTLKSTGRDEALVASAAGSGGGIVAGSRAGLLSHGPKVAYQNQWQTQNAFVANTAPSPAAAPPASPPPQGQLVANSRVPSRSQAAQVQVEAGAPAIESQNMEGKSLDLQNQSIPKQPPNDGYAESKVEKTKPAETLVTVGPTKALASTTPSGGRPFDYLSASPRWAITSSGTLQRSYDQGASWQDVPVKGSPGGAVAGMMMVARESAAQPKPAPAKAKDAAKQSAALDAPILFRAVAAVGNEVWAGGTGGQLYHSSDAGSHWAQVVPSSGNVSLTGDVISLDFSDSQHGRVTTSTREVWLTSDAGQTWQKQ